MGLFDRFKQKKEVKSKQKPEIIPKTQQNNANSGIKDDDLKIVITESNGKIIFKKKVGLKQVKPTREEAELAITEIKKQYEGKLTENLNFMGMDISVDRSSDLVKLLNEAIIENYGTDEEISELKTRKKLIENERIANKLKYGTEKEKEKAIGIYKQNINEGYYQAYYDLAELYQSKREFDKAISIAKEGIGVYSKNDVDTRSLEMLLTNCETSNNLSIIVANNQMGESLEAQGKIKEAQEKYEENVRLNTDTPFTYDRLASIYHYQREFEKERDVLKLAVKRCDKPQVNDRYKTGFKNDLENVESFLNTGKWKYDCLPTDSNPLRNEVQEAKTLLKSDEKQKGIDILENLMENNSYNNTVYYTLYQTYKKDKKFDEAIHVCEMAIKNLGLFSNEKQLKWTEYLEKITAQKEKGENK